MMTWILDLLQAYRMLRSNEQERRDAIERGLKTLFTVSRWGPPCNRASPPTGLSLTEQLQQDRITLREYSGPWRSFDGGYASR